MIDFFQVNGRNMGIVATLFNKCGFEIPAPRNFSRAVHSFNLNLKPVKPASKSFGLKFVDKLASFIL